MSEYQQIRELLDRVRARWRRLLVLQSTIRAALAAAGVLALAMVLGAIVIAGGILPVALVAVALAALALLAAALLWGFWPARDNPSDARVARFIEEHDPSLDDRLVSAIDVSNTPDRAALAGPLVADAARRIGPIDPAAVVPARRMRRTAFQAVAAVLLVGAIAFFGRTTARQAFDAAALTLFPARVALAVTPGHVRVPAGSPITIEARLRGNTAPAVAQVLRAEPAGDGETEQWSGAKMAASASGVFHFALEAVDAPFKYQVVVGAVTSEIYEVRIARPPRVARIDAEYVYPAALQLPPRIEKDAGDIYAPAGTVVRLRVHTEHEAAAGRITLGAGETIPLRPESATVLTGSLKIDRDGSYRLALADREGLASTGDTEYFIRVLEDRPPDVRIVRPARDRAVTRLEEIAIDAEAEDDYGVERLELVYAIRGGAEQVVPLRVPRPDTTVSGSHLLYLEDLDVRPGDFVSYYVRARDVARGKRPSEARSDIFFLEIKPFEQEFALAQSQAAGGAGAGDRSIDDLVAAQKEIIVATWKLDRRARTTSGGRSESDIKAVARAEAELKTRVERTSSAFRESTMRDPRRGQAPGRGGRPVRPSGPEPLRAGQTLPEEDAMTAAAAAMGDAVRSLEQLKTAAALPSEMEALNQLLRAQADVKRRQVMRQQAGAGGGQNRASQDLSSLFDKELARQQQTNYETPASTGDRRDGDDRALDQIRELASRQDELLRRQQELARRGDQLSPEELKRALENLTRDQTELRQRAEEMARQLSRDGQRPQQQQQGAGRPQQGAGQQQQGAGNSQGAGQNSQGAGQNAQGAGRPQQGAGERMRRAAEAMGNAARELRRQDPGQASASGSRALDELQAAERQLQSEAPDERRRALGDMQLEARQLADAQRQVGADGAKAGGDDEARRRAAAAQERLAERARRLQRGLSQQAGAPAAPQGSREERAAAENARTAARDASREIDRQQLAERMQQSADRLRRGDGAAGGGSTRETDEIARALDRLADRLAAATEPKDDESRRVTQQLARAEELRDRIESLTREMERLADQGQEGRGGQQGPPGRAGQAAQQGRGGQEGRAGRAGQEGQEGQGADQGGPGLAEAARLRDAFARELQQARALLEQLQRENPSLARGGSVGLTFEGQGMVLSAPGTEAFKQDFSKWDQLRQQATLALTRAATELSQKLQAKAARDRLAAGIDDRAPAAYQQQVDNYFKALADKPKP